MGRRALPKISPAIDISRHFYRLEECAAPLDVIAQFGRAAPLEVEVGTGKGLFLTRAAQQRPEHNFLGCELAPRYARFAAARLAKAGHANAVVFEGDALRLCREYLQDGGVAAIHVYFPDPWWKKRHRKRRVLQESFLRDVERLLVPDGTLHFWTDVEEYFVDTLALIAAVTKLMGPLPVAETPAAGDLDYRTHFERRTRLQEAPVYRAEFRRPGS